MENAEVVSLRAHIQELKAKNEVLLSRFAGIQKIQMERLLKLRSEKKMSGAVHAMLTRLIQRTGRCSRRIEKRFSG